MAQFFRKNGLLGKIVGGLSKKNTQGDHDKEKAVFPIMNPEMITPLDKPISVSRAVQIYKKYMLKVGYLEKDDISDFVRSLKEDMAEHEEELKFDVKNGKEQVAEAKAEVKRAKKQLKKCKDDDDREYAQEELDSVTAELDAETEMYEKGLEALSLFKKDKRQFLLNYINHEIHGDDWREMQV